MFESKINRGRANGYAPLDSGSKVPLSYLPPIAPVVDTGSLVTAINNLTESVNIINNTTASFATTSSLQTLIDLTGSFATTGSNQFSGSQIITGSLIVSSTFVNDSNLYLSGSDLTVDNGNLHISGNIDVSGSLVVSSTIVNHGTIDAINSDLIIEGGYLILTGSAVPNDLTGSVGDRNGMVVFDNNYLYYCTSSYVGGTPNGVDATGITTHIFDIWNGVKWNGYHSDGNYIQTGVSQDNGGATAPQNGWYIVDDNYTIRQVIGGYWNSPAAPAENGAGWIMTLSGDYVYSDNNPTLTFYETIPTITYGTPPIIWKRISLNGVSSSANVADFTFESEKISNNNITLEATNTLTFHSVNSDIVLNADGNVYKGAASAGNGLVTDGYLAGVIGDTNAVNNSTGHTITDNLTNIINSIPTIPGGLISGSQQIADLGFVTGSYITINTFNNLTQSFNSISQSFTTISGSFGGINLSGLATTGSNTFKGDETISGSLFVSGATELGGNIVPKTPRGATLGTVDRPFRDIFIQSASIHIQSDTPGVADTTLSNVSGNILISAGGMQLLGTGSFNALTASFSYVSGGVYYTDLQSTLNQFSSSLDNRIKNITTGSLVTTSSFNSYTASISTASLVTSITNLNNATSSYETKGRSIVSSSAQITSLGFVSSSITASSIVSASSNTNVILFTKGDGSTMAVTVATGSGNYVTSSYATFHDTTTQSGSANTAYVMKLNSVDHQQGIILSGSGGMQILQAGTYDIEFSAQLSNGAGEEDVDIWLRKNGTNVTDSNTRLTIASNKKLVAAWNWQDTANVFDVFEIMWSSTSGNSTIAAFGTGTSPTRPAVPSVIATIHRVDVGGGSNMVTTGSFNAFTSSINSFTQSFSTSVDSRLDVLEASIITGSVNYVQVLGNSRSGLTSDGTSIISGSITTTGNPVQIIVTGDANPTSGTGQYCKLQIYRDSTAIGNQIQCESSGQNENVPYALNVIDTPPSGTYTYYLKLLLPQGTWQFGEAAGPVLTAVELKTNTNILSKNNTFAGTNTFNDVVTLGASSGDEGGEMHFALAQTNNNLTGSVNIDVWRNRLRLWEGGGNARGVYVDLSKAPDGVGGELLWKASGIVNAGVDVTLGNLKARLASSGNHSLQVSTVSGTYSVYGSSVYSYNGVGGITLSSPLSITTTPTYLSAGYTFLVAGSTDTWNIMDTSSGIAWRITLMIGPSFNNNLISIERLV